MVSVTTAWLLVTEYDHIDAYMKVSIDDVQIRTCSAEIGRL